MAGGLLLVSQFLAAALLLLLAIALLTVKFNSRVNRAFALYLLLEGLVVLFLNTARLNGETDPNDLWLRLTAYAAIALPVSLVLFLVVYRRPMGGLVVRIAVGAALLLAVGLGFAHASDHCAYACLGADGVSQAGPLTAFYAVKPLVQALVAFVLALDVARGRIGPRSRAVFLVAVAFGVLALFESGLSGVLFFTGPLHAGFAPGFWIGAARLLAPPAFALAVAALAVLFNVARREGSTRRPVLLTAAVAAILASILVIAIDEDNPAGNLAKLLAGMWRIVLPAVVAYALVRHRLFDIEVKVRASLVVAFVAAIYGGTYFLVSEGLEAVVSSRYGALGGLAAAALLALLGRPITAMARRAAAYVVPSIHVKSSAPITEREELYRSQFTLLMEDGMLTPKERRLLEQLRWHLGLSEAKAMSIEKASLTSVVTQVAPAAVK